MRTENGTARSDYGYKENVTTDPYQVTTAPDKKTKAKKKFGLVNLMGIFLFLFIVYAGYVILDQQSLMTDKSRDLQTYQQKLSDAQAEAQKLNQEKVIIGSDQYVEKIAREKLGMVKPGEKVLVDTNK